MSKRINIDWQPDKNDKTPIYKQIVNYFSMMIVEGHWSLNENLPTQRDLAKQFNVNRSTIVSAMDELMASGIIETAYGGGTKITNNSWPLLAYSTFTNWRDFISAGPFKSNQEMIQTINKLEFEDYIRLGTGELDPSLFPKKLYDEVMASISKELISLNYLEPLGLLDLRKELVKRLVCEGIKANEQQILITSGSLQALQLISLCMLNDESIVFTEAPSYIKSLQVFQSSGINLAPLSMDDDGIKYWQINTSRLKNKRNQIIYTIPDFHNPTSVSMSSLRREELLKFSLKYNLPIIEDSAYSELFFDKKKTKPLRANSNNNNVLYIGTVSKTLAPGLRVGWIVGPE
ncbi:MAG: PLP-dependent aminotransferase family protein, partial [Erysipelotrichales bacterium]